MPGGKLQELPGALSEGLNCALLKGLDCALLEGFGGALLEGLGNALLEGLDGALLKRHGGALLESLGGVVSDVPGVLLFVGLIQQGFVLLHALGRHQLGQVQRLAFDLGLVWFKGVVLVALGVFAVLVVLACLILGRLQPSPLF